MPDEPILDAEAIDNLRSLDTGDGGEFLREIIGIFIEDTGARIAELKQALAAGDARTFTRAAHSVKGSSSNIGAREVRILAEQLEHRSKDGPLPPLAELLPTLEAAYTRASVELRKLVS